MGKLLFWVFVIVVALLVARIAARSAVKGHRRQSRRVDASRFPADGMVRCAHCGIHLPPPRPCGAKAITIAAWPTR